MKALLGEGRKAESGTRGGEKLSGDKDAARKLINAAKKIMNGEGLSDEEYNEIKGIAGDAVAQRQLTVKGDGRENKG